MSGTLTLRVALRGKPYTCLCAGGVPRALMPGMLLRVIDAGGLFADGFIARWKGPEAVAFCNQHTAELIAGRCIDLQVSRIRAIGGEVRVDVQQCSLAPLPPSWRTVVDGVDVTNIDS